MLVLEIAGLFTLHCIFHRLPRLDLSGFLLKGVFHYRTPKGTKKKLKTTELYPERCSDPLVISSLNLVCL